jgi:glycosyltransferase involved in cell wall biosynthesis
MRILLLSPNQIARYNWGHQLLRNEIGKHHDVLYYGNGYPNFNKNLTAPQIIKKYGPFDLLLTYGLRYSLSFENVDDVKIKKAHIVVDLFPPHSGGYKGGMHTRYKAFLKRNNYDMLFYRQRCQAEYLLEIGCHSPSFWFPFSVDTNIYKKLKLSKKHEVLTSSTTRLNVYPNRIKVNNLVRRMGLKSVMGKIVHRKYIQAINQTKICIISTNVFKSPNMKFTEFTGCGTFVLTDKPADMKQLGFKDGEHFVIYKDLKDLEYKIKYFLKNENERERIAKNGMEFTRKNHNNVIRLKKMFEQIGENMD